MEPEEKETSKNVASEKPTQVKENGNVIKETRERKITIREVPLFGLRAYERNLLIGSSTWLMDDPVKIWEYKGWDVFCRRAPEHPRLIISSRMFFHATCMRWTGSANEFHLYDKNCSTSLEQIFEAIDYWNSHDKDYTGEDDKKVRCVRTDFLSL